MPDVSVKKSRDLAWTDHPQFADVRLAPLMGSFADSAPLLAALVRIAEGGGAPEHLHARQDDILFVLRGQVAMWIEHRGEVELQAGDFLRIPAGLRHQPRRAAGDFLAFNLWARPTSLEKTASLEKQGVLTC